MEEVNHSLIGEENLLLSTFLDHLNKHINANRQARVKRSSKIVGLEIPVTVGDLYIYRDKKILTWRNQIVQVSRIQYNLINTLTASPGCFIPLEMLIERLIADNTTQNPKSLLRETVESTIRSFRSVDSNFDEILYSTNRGCCWG